MNMLGCFLIGVLGGLSESKGILSSEARLFIFVGVIGGFTTFSSFGYETFQLLRDGEFLYGAANAVLQLILGLVCVWLGWIVSRLV